MRFRTAWPLWVVSCLAFSGCSCESLRGEVDSFAFTRCALAAPPAERTQRIGPLELSVSERTLSLSGPVELRVAAFSGPVGAAFSRTHLAQLTAARASLLLVLGGLGDTHEMASANLSALAALRVPTVFIAGGADRLKVVQSAFEELEEEAAQYVLHGSGLRELRIGADRFAVLPGAALGRYALDEESCGFDQQDLSALESAFEERAGNERIWLLSWNAPAGWGISQGHGQVELGSVELAKLAQGLGVRGGLFAYPEVQAMIAGAGAGQGLALVVPKLGRTGTSRADGSRLGAALATVSVGSRGLLAAP